LLELNHSQYLFSHNFREEVSLIYKIYLLLFAKYTISETFLNASTYLFITFWIWLENQIKVETIFFLISSRQTLAIAVSQSIPRGMHEMIKLIAVLKRIGKFLRNMDTQPLSKHKNDEKLPAKITLSNLDVFSRDHKILKNVNCELGNGLTVITGSTASGKTLLLKVILEEYHSIAGVLNVSGRISYASQQPWLFASTVKQNVLFGAKYNEERYLLVLQVCALLHDIQSLPGGDGFIVADRGANLSKGQQSRINLARAVYRDVEIYLLDDCLANLDVLVADYIFEKCIKQFLRDKLVVLVTQNPKHIGRADIVEILNDPTAKFSENISATLIQQDIRNLGLAWTEDKCKEEDGVVEADDNETTHLFSANRIERNIYEEKIMPETINLTNYKKLIAHGGGFIMFVFICIVFGVVVISKSGLRKLENNW
jgi:ATP-binding cassette subfamily C (CFTR/MRP) protein 4